METTVTLLSRAAPGISSWTTVSMAARRCSVVTMPLTVTWPWSIWTSRPSSPTRSSWAKTSRICWLLYSGSSVFAPVCDDPKGKHQFRNTQVLALAIVGDFSSVTWQPRGSSRTGSIMPAPVVPALTRRPLRPVMAGRHTRPGPPAHAGSKIAWRTASRPLNSVTVLLVVFNA